MASFKPLKHRAVQIKVIPFTKSSTQKFGRHFSDIWWNCSGENFDKWPNMKSIKLYQFVCLWWTGKIQHRRGRGTCILHTASVSDYSRSETYAVHWTSLNKARNGDECKLVCITSSSFETFHMPSYSMTAYKRKSFLLRSNVKCRSTRLKNILNPFYALNAVFLSWVVHWAKYYIMW
jgi:hypothetical protein